MSALAHRISEADGATTLHLGGALDRHIAGELSRVLDAHRPAKDATLSLDLGDVESMDSAAVAAIANGIRYAEAAGGRVRLARASPPAERALSMFRLSGDPVPPPVPAVGFEAIGGAVVEAGAGLVGFLQLAADTTFALVGTLAKPRRMRWRALMEQSIDIGSRAIGIVGLITFLVGLTVAFQSAHQLRQFGAAIFVADLTAVSMVREMAPLMTAILVAGRSGSSIAAEVATMQVSEEVDALTVMGMNPISYLAVPRLLAIVLTVPLLTVLADVLGMLGGFLVGVGYLDIAWNAFLNQMLDAIGPWDLISGLLKSLVFAYGIGLIGLFYGFRVRGGASEVGRTTTASVVAAIFFIIVADCVFSVLFYVVL